MSDRRTFLKATAMLAGGLAVASPERPRAEPPQLLPRRAIPGTDVSLPVIGLGNSNAFRQGDVETSTALLRLFHGSGGAYVDCNGDSRFLVASVAKSLGISADIFLGTYFGGNDLSALDEEALRLLQLTGKKQLDLAHAYPEFARPNWDMFRRWKDEGLARFIGIARHSERYYPEMMKMMATDTVDFLQVNYSLLEPEAEQEILPMALDRGVAVTINRPFINGRYFAHVKGHELPPWAVEFDCSSWAQFSLKFILAHPAVTCVLTETANPVHAQDNIGGGLGRMPDEKTRGRMLQHIRSL